MVKDEILVLVLWHMEKFPFTECDHILAGEEEKFIGG